MFLYKKIINEVAKVVKKEINEAFDFNSVNKEKKSINAANYIYDIIEKIIGKDKNIDISIARYNLLKPYIGIYKPKNKRELQRIIKRCIKFFGNECDLNWIDVSNITSMSELFHWSDFNGDISQWDVRKVKYMAGMFAYSDFNGDISKWDVNNVESMRGMFEHSKFNRDISKWDVRVCCDMRWMFDKCSIIDEYKPIDVIKYGKGGVGNY